MKLFILRIIVIITLFVAKIATGIIRLWSLYFPISSLLHYVVGSGKNVSVPYKVMEQARQVFLSAMKANNYGNMALNGEYSVSRSTMYEGRGFYGRPILFYMVGCFNFTFCNETVKFSDEYDWHCNENGAYFTSPIGSNIAFKIIGTILGAIWGYDLFIVPGKSSYANIICTNPDNVCISNKLWEVIGGKPFMTVGEYDLQLTKDEIDGLYEYVLEKDAAYYNRAKYVRRTVVDSFAKKHSALGSVYWDWDCSYNPDTDDYIVEINKYGTKNCIVLHAVVDDENVVHVYKHHLHNGEFYGRQNGYIPEYNLERNVLNKYEEPYDEYEEEYDEDEEEYEEYDEGYEEDEEEEYDEQYEEE